MSPCDSGEFSEVSFSDIHHFVLTNFTFFPILKEMEEHMRSMLHHRELENLKGRYENNLASFLSVQFVCHSLEELMSYFSYKLNCTIYIYASLVACLVIKLTMFS